MNEAPTHDALDDVAEEFARRWRDGEQPSIEDYAARFPQWAADIRELFPAVLMMEQLKPRRTEQSSVAPSPETSRIPERLGEYHVLRELGRGGMGVVYEAQQETLGRHVAIKVLPAQLFNNEKLRLRFRRESQAAARLHHTNIVPVFGVGEQDGLCYYVMQLIPGKSIDIALGDATCKGSPPTTDEPARHGTGEKNTNAAAARRSASTAIVNGKDTPLLTTADTDADSTPAPERQHFSPRAVAQIGVQVADALAYAHAHGVLHRDIKPSNLLLDQRGMVWVTDFGVAKLVEEANLTQSGDLVGTLKYMPPERFLGQSDARGDVYSLAITLYELLAHRPAFPDTTPQHLIQLISQTDPPRLRKLDPTIATDLETIVLKAAARDPAQRYQTAADLAADLRRFLDDRPVLARRTSAAEQVWRWCRRNRVLAGLATTACLLLVITTIVSVAAYLRTSAAGRETDAANVEMKKALEAEKTQREHAENTSASALEALNRIFDRFAPNRIVVTPALPTESSTAEGLNVPAQPILSPEAVPLLKELLASYEQFAQEGSEHPRLQFQAAQANQRIGDIRQRLGQFELAIAAYRKALDLYERSADDTRDDAAGIKVARTYNELGRALRTLQQTEEARTVHARALSTLLAVPKKFAARPENRYELARTYYFQSQQESMLEPPSPLASPRSGPDDFGRGSPSDRGPQRGPPPERDRGHGPGDGGRKPPEHGGPLDHGGDRDNASAKQAVTLLKDLVKEYPTVPEYRHLLACCYRDGPPDFAARGPQSNSMNFDRAVDLLRQLVKEYPKVPDYRYDLCETLARAGSPRPPMPGEAAGPAQQQLQDAIKLSSELVAEYPNVPQYAASHAQVHDRLGVLLHQHKLLEESEKVLRKGVSLQTDLVKQHPEVVAYSFSLALMQASLAHTLTDRNNWTEARTLLEASANRLDALRKKDPRLGFVRMFLNHRYSELSDVLTKLGEKELAKEAKRKAGELGHDGEPGRGPDNGR